MIGKRNGNRYEASGAGCDQGPADKGLNAVAGDGLHLLRVRDVKSSVRRSLYDGARDRVLAIALHRRDQRQGLILGNSKDLELGQCRLALHNRPCLVEQMIWASTVSALTRLAR